MVMNRRVILQARPDGQPRESDFAMDEVEVAEPGEGMVLIEVDYLSVDAFTRTTLTGNALHGIVELGAPVTALGVGRVLASGDASLSPGDAVFGPTLTLLVGPYGREADVIQHQRPDHPAAHKVADNARMMRAITVDEVLCAALERLSRCGARSRA